MDNVKLTFIWLTAYKTVSSSCALGLGQIVHGKIEYTVRFAEHVMVVQQ